MILSDRLKKIADCINCRMLADIGTDHGYVPIYCVENGRCDFAVACDINQGPLDSAQENIRAHGLEGKITTRLSDGLEKLNPDEADTIVIAGMGGFLVRDILIAGADKIGDASLILQPMVAVEELRSFLVENGYNIYLEKLSREGNKFYNILCVKKGKCSYSPKEILLGKYIEQDENYGDYTAFRKGVIEKIISGLEKSDGKENEIEFYKEKLALIE